LGTGFYGSNDLTNSVKALKELGSKDQASIPSGPPCTLTIIQQLRSMKQKYTQINTNLRIVIWAQC